MINADSGSRHGPSEPDHGPGLLTTSRVWNDANFNYVPDCVLTEPSVERRVRSRRQPEFRRTRAPRGRTIRRRTTAGARAPTTGSSRPAFSSEVAPRVRRGGRVSFRRIFGNFTVQDNRRRRRPTTRSTASRRRSIRGCPVAAATSWAGSTTSTRTRSGRSSNLVTFSDNYGKIHRALERRSTSPSTRGRATAWCCRAG